MKSVSAFITVSLLGTAFCSPESPRVKMDMSPNVYAKVEADSTVLLTVVQTITSASVAKQSPASVNAGKMAAAQASSAALASIASMFTAQPSASIDYQLAAASAAASAASADINASESAALMSIASLLANSPSVQAPTATMPSMAMSQASPPASRVPDISAVPAVAAVPKATVVAGHGTDAQGEECSCQCLCGSMPMPAGSRAGIGAFGGLVGALPAGAMAGKPT